MGEMEGETAVTIGGFGCAPTVADTKSDSSEYAKRKKARTIAQRAVTHTAAVRVFKLKYLIRAGENGSSVPPFPYFFMDASISFFIFSLAFGAATNT